MFGKNERFKKEPIEDYDGTVEIQSIFYTIQGEGPFSGAPSIFVRFAKCSLACRFCDTEFSSGVTKDIEEIVQEVEDIQQQSGFPHPLLVVITGGEPLLQYGLGDLIYDLVRMDHHIQIETSGSVFYSDHSRAFDCAIHDTGLTVVCSPKTGGVNKELLSYITDYKYVVGQDNMGVNGLPCTSFETNLPLRIFTPPNFQEMVEDGHVFISPIDSYDDGKNKKNLKLATMSCLNHGYRLSLQVHKIVNLP